MKLFPTALLLCLLGSDPAAAEPEVVPIQLRESLRIVCPATGIAAEVKDEAKKGRGVDAPNPYGEILAEMVPRGARPTLERGGPSPWRRG